MGGWMYARRSALLAVTATLTIGLPAQATLRVGPGAFAQIGDAIAAAQPGDTILVATGTYAAFTCDKPLVIAAEQGATPDVLAPLGFPLPTFVARFEAPAGQTVRVSGLRFDAWNVFGAIPLVHVRSGIVSFEDCAFTPLGRVGQALLVEDAEVWLRDCTLTAYNPSLDAPAMTARRSTVCAVDCRFTGSDLGGDGGLPGSPGGGGGGDGILADDSAIHLVGCTLQGGDSAAPCNSYPAGDGLQTNRGELTWIADSVLGGGAATCSIGAGLRVTSPLPASIARNSVTGAPPVSGPASSAQLVGLASPPPPPTLGAPFTLAYRTQPGADLFLFFSLDLDASRPPVTLEPIWAPANGFAFLDSICADTVGVAQFSTSIPNLPALAYVGIWVHAIDPAVLPWRTAPPVGGLLR